MTTAPVESKQRPVLVFVHGFWGSTLEAKTHGKKLWFPPLMSLLFRRHRTDLASPITWTYSDPETGLAIQDTDAITAGDVLFTYGKFIKFLDRVESATTLEVHQFLWDWRRTFEESSNLLEQFLASLHLGEDRQAVLVSHSTGSTISWPVINQHPQWFKTWITVGGALGTSNLTLGMLENGWRAGPLTLLDPETMFTHASMYCFYCDVAAGEPTDCTEGVHFAVGSGRELDIDLFDSEQWEKRNLGLFAVRQKKGGAVSPAERQHLENCLRAAKQFRNKHFVRIHNGESSLGIHDPAFLAMPHGAYDHLRIICYGSDDHPTHKGFGFEDASGTIDTLAISHHPGDGTVRSDGWRSIRGGLRHDVVSSTAQHVALCDDQPLHRLMCQVLDIDESLASPPATRKGWALAAGALAVIVVLALATLR